MPADFFHSLQLSQPAPPGSLPVLGRSKLLVCTLISKAKPVLDAASEFGGKSDRDVMVDAIKAVRGDSIALDERSDDYVLAMFDTISEDAANRADSTEDLRKAVASIATPASAPSSYMEKLQNAWKSPLSISKEAK